MIGRDVTTPALKALHMHNALEEVFTEREARTISLEEFQRLHDRVMALVLGAIRRGERVAAREP